MIEITALLVPRFLVKAYFVLVSFLPTSIEQCDTAWYKIIYSFKCILLLFFPDGKRNKKIFPVQGICFAPVTDSNLYKGHLTPFFESLFLVLHVGCCDLILRTGVARFEIFLNSLGLKARKKIEMKSPLSIAILLQHPILK